MEEMKLWAELTMSVQKEETKSSTESDGAFTSALCKAVGTQRHRVPSPPTPKTTPRGDTDGLSPALLQSPIPTPHGHRRAPLGLTPTHSPIPRRPPPRCPPALCSHSGSGRSLWQIPTARIFGRCGSLLFLTHPCSTALLPPALCRPPPARSERRMGQK